MEMKPQLIRRLKTETAALKIWVDPGSGDFYKELLKDYKDESGADVTIEVVESDTAKAQEYLKKDPESAADVFSVPHDQLGQMVEAGIVYENTKYVDEINDNNTEQSVKGAMYQGKLYGYPYGIEGMMLYYDKSKLTEEDVKTFEGLGTIPCNKESQEAENVKNNPMASTVVKLASEEYSVVMPKLPEMVTFWPTAAAVISDAYKGNIPVDEMMGKLDQLVKDTSAAK